MMMLQSLQDCEFVRGIPAELVRRLDQIAHTSSFAPGVTIFMEGSLHPTFHVIAEGHIRLEMLVPQRGRVPVLTAGRGEVIAWSALTGDSIMTATAVALEPVTLVSFPGAQLKQLCEAEHEIGYHVLRQLSTSLSRRLVATRLQLLDLFETSSPKSR